MIERTFAMIKPDAVGNHHIGAIISAIEENGFRIKGLRLAQLTDSDVRRFYAVHKERSFFNEMVSFVVSGPVVLMALEKENAIGAWRNLMGATNPADAAPGTIRKLFGTSIGSNATHGSDAAETAKLELEQFFPELV